MVAWAGAWLLRRLVGPHTDAPCRRSWLISDRDVGRCIPLCFVSVVDQEQHARTVWSEVPRFFPERQGQAMSSDPWTNLARLRCLGADRCSSGRRAQRFLPRQTGGWNCRPPGTGTGPCRYERSIEMRGVQVLTRFRHHRPTGCSKRPRERLSPHDTRTSRARRPRAALMRSRGRGS
jgi:hypothetical protein